MGASLHCGAQAYCGGFSGCGEWALGAWASVAAVCGLSSFDSPALEHRLNSLAQGLSCTSAHGIFLDQRLNLCPLHWQAGFLSTVPPGKFHHFLICYVCLLCFCSLYPLTLMLQLSHVLYLHTLQTGSSQVVQSERICLPMQGIQRQCYNSCSQQTKIF